MAYVATSSLGQVNFSRLRQVANNLATQTMEEVRALPFATISAGLLASDVSGGDANITTGGACGSNYCYRGEIIPTTSTVPPVPLDPHASTRTLNGSTFTISTYVTEYNNVTSPNVLRVTVNVAWSGSGIGGVASSIKVQTLVYSSSTGCLSNTTHPFAGPCQPSFIASATDGVGQVTVTPDSTYGTPVSLISAALNAVLADDTLTMSQVSSLTGSVQNSGAKLQYGSTTTTQGTAQVSASADSDPATSGGRTYGTASTTPNPSGTLSLSDGGGSTFSVVGSAGDTATADDTTSASATNACTDLGGTAVLNLEPCTFQTASQAAATSATLHVKEAPSQGTSDLGTATLVSIPSETAKTFATYQNASGGSYCTQTSGDGCVDSRATRTVGTVTMGGLPSGVSAPTGWLGYLVQISGWTDTVTSEVGVGTVAPTASNSASIKYWTGSGYSTATVGTTSSSLTVSSVSRSGSLGGQSYTVTETVAAGGATTGSASVSDPGSCTPPCTRQSVTSATSTSPQVTIDYQVAWGAEKWGLVVSFNLGSLSASDTYGVAPGAG